MHPVGGHAVGGNHCAQSDGVFIATLVAHHADRLHRQQNSACLPDAVVQVVGHLIRIGSAWEFTRPVAQAFDEDVVGIAKDAEFLFGHFTQDADAQARSRERMAAY